MAFLNTLKDGLPIDPLPPKRPRDNSVPHAPVRNTHLTPEEEQIDEEKLIWDLFNTFLKELHNIMFF
ncbi:hypothetical protein AVEN_40864-1 [Araneus ventricosus]|uniref:Uncharacterized protein n=1 Tax=Araneus ventricosus TaxID=182803 RepID=A0A4Y2QR42_ARAVE|nr:hypothetical protein AVEN_40864-1 [Araneus ventricosus]